MFIDSWLGSVVFRNFVRVLSRTASVPAAALAALACGGPPDAQTPQSGTDGDADEATTRDLEPPLSEGDPLGDEKHEPKPELTPSARCEGGQCFECGDNLCPEGFYCDGNKACAWLPQCTGTQLTCACLTSKLSGCDCSSESDHLTVSCGE